MAAVMDVDKVKSPTIENGGGLFDPISDDLEDQMSKLALVSPNNEEFDQLCEDITARLNESQGETIYEIGTADGQVPGLKEADFDASVATLQSLAQALNLECMLLREKPAAEGKVAEFLLRRKMDSGDFMEVRVAVVGNVDAGKSTLLGVLTHGELDNGRGTARMKLFRHKHEMESGRTSSVGNDILGFDSHGSVVNRPDHSSLDWVKVCENSSAGKTHNERVCCR